MVNHAFCKQNDKSKFPIILCNSNFFQKNGVDKKRYSLKKLLVEYFLYVEKIKQTMFNLHSVFFKVLI